jgi:pyruvate dehydrogenase E1 component
MPAGAEEGIKRGMYLFREAEPAPEGSEPAHVQLLGSGTILREVIAAADLLRQDWNVASDIWSCTSFTELRRNGLACERWNLLNPTSPSPRANYVQKCLKGRKGPAIAATDYMKSFADQIRPFVPMPYHVLGTDGFGRSDTRENLRSFFEVDRYWIVVTALRALADLGEFDRGVIAGAIAKYGLDPAKPDPVTV